MGAGQHLAERGGRDLNGGLGFAVFAEAEMAIEFEHGEGFVAHADRDRPAGDHLVAQGGLDARAERHGSQVGDPDGAAILPGAAGQVSAFFQGESHALLDEGLGAVAGSAPGGAELEPILFGVDLPFDGQVPALGDAEGLENAHGGDFRGGVFTHDLADHQLQSEAMLALLLLGDVAQQATHGQWISGFLALAQAQLQFQHAAVG